jgi:hypothetical protein
MFIAGFVMIVILLAMIWLGARQTRKDNRRYKSRTTPQSAIDNWGKLPVRDPVTIMGPADYADSLMNKLEKDWAANHPTREQELEAEIKRLNDLVKNKSTMIARLTNEKQISLPAGAQVIQTSTEWNSMNELQMEITALIPGDSVSKIPNIVMQVPRDIDLDAFRKEFERELTTSQGWELGQWPY